MKTMVVDEKKELVQESYVLRIGGWTLERYFQEAPEDLIWEFVRGEVIMYSPATAEHQDLVGFLYWLLRGYCEAKGLGKVLTGPAAVKILPNVVREKGLNERQIKAVSYIREKGSITNKEYQMLFYVSRITATRDFKLLEGEEILKRIGKGKRNLKYVLK